MRKTLKINRIIRKLDKSNERMCRSIIAPTIIFASLPIVIKALSDSKIVYLVSKTIQLQLGGIE